MNIYLDSADAKSWALPPGCPPVVGVTTNPSLIHQAGLPVNLATYERLLQAVGEQGLAELMLQLPASAPVLARQWVVRLQHSAMRARVRMTIKVPCHPDWLPCIQAVQKMGQAILLTAVSNPVQLLWAKSLKVAYVAPYVGRLAADGRDVRAFMQACVAVQNDKSDKTAPGPALLAASIKSPEVLSSLIGLGAAAVTLPPASLIAWANDPLTQFAMAQFEQDTAASLSGA
jgi:transaldolase